MPMDKPGKWPDIVENYSLGKKLVIAKHSKDICFVWRKYKRIKPSQFLWAPSPFSEFSSIKWHRTGRIGWHKRHKTLHGELIRQKQHFDELLRWKSSQNRYTEYSFTWQFYSIASEIYEHGKFTGLQFSTLDYNLMNKMAWFICLDPR